MRTTLAGLTIAAALLALPAAASAEVCSQAFGTPARTDTARSDVGVLLDRSIGPIAIGMTKSSITRVTRTRGRKVAGTRSWTWTVSGVAVRVTFGRYGRVHKLFARSNRLVVAGARLGDGADAIAAKLPSYKRAHCDVDTELWQDDVPERTHLWVPHDPRAHVGSVEIVSRSRVPLD